MTEQMCHQKLQFNDGALVRIYEHGKRSGNDTFFTKLVCPVHWDRQHRIRVSKRITTHQPFKNASLPVASHSLALSCNLCANDAGPP